MHRWQPIQVELCRAFGPLTRPLGMRRGRGRLLFFSLAMSVVHLTEPASARGLEGKQGIVSAGMRRWEMFWVEVHLVLRAAENVMPDESHELVHGSLVWDGTSALHVRDLKARLETGQLLGTLLR